MSRMESMKSISDIPLRGTHCLGDSDIEFAFTGGQWMEGSDDLRLTHPSTKTKLHDFLRTCKSLHQFANRHIATTSSARR